MRKDNSGWFVEVPTELKQKFQELYGGRAAMRRLTIVAIKRAIELHPSQPEKEKQNEEA